jgi:excisionase family DNA binding protein
MTKKPETDAGAKFLPPSEAAGRLHVSTRTLTRMADRGDLHVVKLPSGHRRYLVSEVEALLPESARTQVVA